MDFHRLTPDGDVHILSTDDDGRIVTPLPAELADILDKTTVDQPCDHHSPETT